MLSWIQVLNCKNCKQCLNCCRRQSCRPVKFETLITILTIENLNSWQSLLLDNYEWHWTAFAILAMFWVFIRSDLSDLWERYLLKHSTEYWLAFVLSRREGGRVINIPSHKCVKSANSTDNLAPPPSSERKEGWDADSRYHPPSDQQPPHYLCKL